MEILLVQLVLPEEAGSTDYAGDARSTDYGDVGSTGVAAPYTAYANHSISTVLGMTPGMMLVQLLGMLLLQLLLELILGFLQIMLLQLLGNDSWLPQLPALSCLYKI